MKLSKTDSKKIAEFRKKIEDAKMRDIIRFLEKIGYDTESSENLKKQLEAGKIAAPIMQLLKDVGYDTANHENLKKQLEAGKPTASEFFESQLEQN